MWHCTSSGDLVTRFHSTAGSPCRARTRDHSARKGRRGASRLLGKPSAITRRSMSERVVVWPRATDPKSTSDGGETRRACSRPRWPRRAKRGAAPEGWRKIRDRRRSLAHIAILVPNGPLPERGRGHAASLATGDAGRHTTHPPLMCRHCPVSLASRPGLARLDRPAGATIKVGKMPGYLHVQHDNRLVTGDDWCGRFQPAADELSTWHNNKGQPMPRKRIALASTLWWIPCRTSAGPRRASRKARSPTLRPIELGDKIRDWNAAHN